MKLALLTFIIYFLINLFVTRRINKSYYIREEMKRFHKKFIWFLPFLGPLLIKNFWIKHKPNTNKAITKSQRDKSIKYDGFYESGQGIDV